MPAKFDSSDVPIYSFRATVWIYEGPAGWYFVTLPTNLSAEIKAMFGYLSTGWGALAVTATIGQTSWKTSIFRDKKLNSYLLPLKADIRRKEKIQIEDVVEISLKVKI